MKGSSFGEIFNITTFGESHGKAVGVIVDGVPSGIEIDEKYINSFMERRRPGKSQYATTRFEEDRVKIYSGVFEGKTTGTPIMLMVENKDHNSKDYSNIMDLVRPGHADYTYIKKYGIRDYRGGGRASARETLARVAAGAIAIKALSRLGISFLTYTKSIGTVESKEFDESFIKENELCMPDRIAYERCVKLINETRSDCDSLGGVVTCIVRGVMPGLGEPVFDKLDALIGHAIMSIGAVKAVEIGDGVAATRLKGSENNDIFYNDNGKVSKKTNHSGGILGGISDGSNIVVTAHFKPTPSISKNQNTVDLDGNDKVVSISGRHDPIVVARANPVVEAMVAIVVFDAVLKNMTSSINKIIDFYGGDIEDRI